MTPEQLAAQLQPLVSEQHSQYFCYQLVDKWKAAGITAEQVIEPVLRFMEHHEDVDLGLPGPFIHFMETCELRDTFGRDLYEKLLIESLERKPVAYTLWMLNRVLNITKTGEHRERLLAIMRSARSAVLNNPRLLEIVDGDLQHQTRKAAAE